MLTVANFFEDVLEVRRGLEIEGDFVKELDVFPASPIIFWRGVEGFNGDVDPKFFKKPASF